MVLKFKYILIKYGIYKVYFNNDRSADELSVTDVRVDFSNNVLNFFNSHVHFFVGDVLVRHDSHSCIVYLCYPHGCRSYLVVRLTVAFIRVYLCNKYYVILVCYFKVKTNTELTKYIGT